MALRLLTWNILGCRGFPAIEGGPVAFTAVHPGVIAGVAARLREWEIDVALLQEAPPADDVQALARLAGMQAVCFPAQAASGPDYPFGFPGAVLSRLPPSGAVDLAATVRVPEDHRFHRHWGSAVIATASGPLRVASTHLCADWGGVQREGTRLEEVACLLAGPPVDLIAGDCNAGPDSAPIARLREGHGDGDGDTVDTRCTVGYRIDYVWLAPASPWRVRTARVGDVPRSDIDGVPVLLSDHFPVIIEVDSGV